MRGRTQDGVKWSAARRGLAAGLAATIALGIAPCTEGHALAAMSLATTSRSEAPPAADQPTAEDLSAQAIERFQAKDYDAAVRLFEEAYALDKVPNYLFNIGRVYEEKGDIRAAVDFYQRFVKEPGVELDARDLALQRLRVLRGILQETDPDEPEPDDDDAAAPNEPTPAPVVAPTPAPAPSPPPPPDPKWRTMKIAGAAVLGVGAGALLTGGILGGVTLSKQSQLDSTHDYDARLALKASGERLALTTDVLIGVGAALVITGAVLVAVGATRGRTRAVAARRVWPTGFGVAGRF